MVCSYLQLLTPPNIMQVIRLYFVVVQIFFAMVERCFGCRDLYAISGNTADIMTILPRRMSTDAVSNMMCAWR